MGYIEEERQAMLEERIFEKTKESYGPICGGCQTQDRILHNCQGDEQHECICQYYKCKREREKRS